MKEIFTEINSLIERSSGNMIRLASGEEYSFSRSRLYSEPEVESFESKYEVRISKEYKHFLTTVGACDLFIDEYESGVKFHPLENIEEYSKEVFIDMKNPFPDLLLVVSLTGRGDEGGFDLTREEPNFSVFSHEEDPEMWAEETINWVAFSKWLTNLVKSEGQDDLP